VQGDARSPAAWGVDASTIDGVTVGFALEGIPAEWTLALRPGTPIVAPIVTGGTQHLHRVIVGERTDRFDEVTYVRERREVPALAAQRARSAQGMRLPVVRE
jgi:protein-L-isoaspartate O-methyltransferase